MPQMTSNKVKTEMTEQTYLVKKLYSFEELKNSKTYLIQDGSPPKSSQSKF
jgi:hypothetical protein